MTQRSLSNTPAVQPDKRTTATLLASTVSTSHMDAPALPCEIDTIGQWLADRPNGVHTNDQMNGGCPTQGRSTLSIIPAHMRGL